MGRNRLLEQGQCRGVGNHPKGHSPSQGCGSHPSDRRQTGHCLKQGGNGKGMVSTGVNFNPKYFCTSSRSVCRSCSPAPTDEESDIWTGLPSVRRKFKTVSDLLGVETEAPSFRQFSATFQISRVSNAALKTPSFFTKNQRASFPNRFCYLPIILHRAQFQKSKIGVRQTMNCAGKRPPIRRKTQTKPIT